MSFIFRKLKGTFTNPAHNDNDIEILQKKNKLLTTELLKQAGTPYPRTDLFDVDVESDIRIPRVPHHSALFYFLRWHSPVLRTICLKLKQEVFRETLKTGFEFIPAFALKCQCGAEFDETVDQCHYCQSTNLREPNPIQKKAWEDFVEEVNKAEQPLLGVFQELEDDLNTDDNAYLILIKEYIVVENELISSKIHEILRGNPILFRIVADNTGRRGGKYFVCPTHRGLTVQEAPGYCKKCNLQLRDVHYVETEAGGKDPVKYYIQGEVIHVSKYEPSKLYGISPVLSLWILVRTLMLMDRYVQELYEKGRVKGILGIGTDNTDYLKKWIDDTQEKLKQDPHYIPIVAMESGEGGKKGAINFVKMLDSLREMDYGPAKDMMRQQIAALYGVMPVFQADVSTAGGLNNEGLQITVTDRAVEFGQAIYHNAILPKLAKELHITDWKIQLRPSREIDEMAKIQRFDLRSVIAQRMLEMGFDVKLKGDEFVFSGQATKPAGLKFPLHTPTPLPGGAQPVTPDNTETTPCPPGKHRTIENPRCHPIEWDMKSKSEMEKRGFELAHTKDLTKWGDMMAYFACIIKKIQRSGYKIPENLTYKELNDWGKTNKDLEFQKFWKKACKLCKNQEDPDFPKPPMSKAKSPIEVFKMIRKKDMHGKSGTGEVGIGIIFADGKTIFRWNSENPSINHYDSFEVFQKVHVEDHDENQTELQFIVIDETNIDKILKSILPNELLKAVESGRKLDQAVNQIESEFAKTIIKYYETELEERIGKLKIKDSEKLRQAVDELTESLQPKLEKIAFSEVLTAFRKGKQLDKEVEKAIPINWSKLPFSKTDVKVLRSIFTKNPLWKAFSELTSSISTKFKEIISKSYLAPTEARFKATLRDVKRQYPNYSLERQMNIAYGRIGKFSLPRTIEAMKRTVDTDVYRLERIARSETTAITAVGRELAFRERDPENTFKYDWFGPVDHRTSDQCKEIERRVDKLGKGQGVSLDQLKQIQKDVVEEFNRTQKSKWTYRDYLPHANCRRVLRRVS